MKAMRILAHVSISVSARGTVERNEIASLTVQENAPTLYGKGI